jgi:hypothetical protein
MHTRTDNRVELEGTVHDVPWLSYGRGQRGRVNFWLQVSRELAGEGVDIFHCAIEPKSGDEVLRLEREVRAGRTVRIVAIARSRVDLELPLDRQAPSVIFVAEECGLDDEPSRSAHSVGLPRRSHPHGKAAAAGDDLALLEAGSEVAR